MPKEDLLKQRLVGELNLILHDKDEQEEIVLDLCESIMRQINILVMQNIPQALVPEFEEVKLAGGDAYVQFVDKYVPELRKDIEELVTISISNYKNFAATR